MTKRMKVSTMVLALAMTVGPTASGVAQAADGDVVLAHGKVITAGKAPARNAQVTMLAWPTDKQLAAMKVGDTFKLQVLSTTETDDDGNYALSIDSIASLAPVADWAGNVNVDIRAIDAQGTQTQVSVPLAPTLGAAAKQVQAGAAPRAMSDSVAADVPVMVFGKLGETTAEVEARVGKSVPAPPTGFDKDCSTQYISDLGLHTALIGAHYDTTSYVRHDWEFNVGASTTLGVGVSPTGAQGTWKASGSVTNSASTSISWPEATANQHVYTDYSWGKYRTRCFDGSTLLSQSYSARVRTLAGGASTYSPASAPAVSKCTYYAKGASMSKTQTKQTTHATGSDVSGVIGIDLSVQSGYTTASKVSYRFDEGRDLCGTKDYPASSYPSGLLVGRL